MKDKILNTNRDVVNGANKSKENCNLISDGHEKSISVPDQSYTQIIDRHEVIYLSRNITLRNIYYLSSLALTLTSLNLC